MNELRNVNLEELLSILVSIHNSTQEETKEIIWWCEDNKLVLGFEENKRLYVIPNKVV
jgi:hypothetical protein